MKAKVSVTLKRGILDPQGQAVLHALGSLGYSGVKDVRMGKLIELELATNDRAGAEAEVKAMCERLLANTIIEDYRIELILEDTVQDRTHKPRRKITFDD